MNYYPYHTIKLKSQKAILSLFNASFGQKTLITNQITTLSNAIGISQTIAQ